MKTQLHVTRFQTLDANGEPLLMKIEGGDSHSTAAFLRDEFLGHLSPAQRKEAIIENESALVTGLAAADDLGMGISTDNGVAEDVDAGPIPLMPVINFSKPAALALQKAALDLLPLVSAEVVEEIPLMPVMNFQRKAA